MPSQKSAKSPKSPKSPSLPPDSPGSPPPVKRSLVVRNIPNAITCITILCGFALMLSTSIPGVNPRLCILITLLGLVCDVLDGEAARRLRVKSSFGATFDQLADLTCFGIGPGIFVTRQVLDHHGTSDLSIGNILGLTAGYAYVTCSVFRIARELIVHKGARPLYFLGIPTNLASFFAVPLAATAPASIVTPFIIIFLSAMMVMPVPIPKGLGFVKVTDTEVTSSCSKRSLD